jgi:hypothetical protein
LQFTGGSKGPCGDEGTWFAGDGKQGGWRNWFSGGSKGAFCSDVWMPFRKYSRLFLTCLSSPSIYVFSILLFCLPSPVWLITLIVISSLCFLVEFRYESHFLQSHFSPTFRISFGQCCAWSSTLLLAAKISLHLLISIHASIERVIHFALERLRVPQLLAVLALGIALLEGRICGDYIREDVFSWAIMNTYRSRSRSHGEPFYEHSLG